MSGTVMCYGQTGAGKTFTMTGSAESYQNRGIIPRAISQLFKELDERSDCATVVRCSASAFSLILMASATLKILLLLFFNTLGSKDSEG